MRSSLPTLLALTLLLPACGVRRDRIKQARLDRDTGVKSKMMDEPDWVFTAKDKDLDAAKAKHKSCLGGDMAACTDLAIYYVRGSIVERNHPRAVALLGKACDAGELSGCMNLGIRYAQGQGVLQNRHKAFGYYGRACKAGHMESCMHMGFSYALGEAVDRDYAKALKLFATACKRGV